MRLKFIPSFVKRKGRITKKQLLNLNYLPHYLVTNIDDVIADSYKYKKYGLPILHDQVGGFFGPLAGILTAMKWAGDIGCERVITVAVDTPLFPKNLLKELYKKMEEGNSDIVFAASLKDHKQGVYLHPVFGLWKTYLHDDLRRELERGVRKVTFWSEKHKTSSVCFANDLIDPFFNINTPDDIKIFKEYQLANAQQAHQDLESRKLLGPAILVP